MRSQTRELTDFAKVVAQRQSHPILNAWHYRKKAIAAIFLLAIYCNSSFYTFFVYMPSYLQQQELPLTTAMDVIIIGMICYSMGLLLSGFTSDILGRRFPLAVSLIATLCTVLVINYLINTGTLLQITVACSVLAVIISFLLEVHLPPALNNYHRKSGPVALLYFLTCLIPYLEAQHHSLFCY